MFIPGQNRTKDRSKGIDMRIGIDLDGTAWAHRELFKAMIHGFIACGHEVGIVTAHNERLKEADLDLWDARGFLAPSFYIAKSADGRELHVPPEIWKPEMMKKHNLDYLFDDLETEEVRLLTRKVN